MGSGGGRVTSIKRALQAGHAVVFGADVDQAFLAYSGEGIIGPPGGAIAGGHAMCIVGYDHESFTIVNSWTESWGDGGFARLSAEYVGSDYATDFWIVAGWDRLREQFNARSEVVA